MHRRQISSPLPNPPPTIARSLPAAAAKQSASHGGVGAPRQGACWDHGRRRRSSPTLRRKKVNTPFRQDGPAAWLPSGTSRLLLGLSDRRAGSRAAGVAQRGDEDVGFAGDQRHRVHRAVLLTLRAVRRDAANSERLGGGNDLANSGAISLSGAREGGGAFRVDPLSFRNRLLTQSSCFCFHFCCCWE